MSVTNHQEKNARLINSTSCQPQNLPGINMDDALNRLKISRENFSQCLSIFFESNATIVADICNALKRGDELEARKLLHRLRGSSANISADDVVQKATELSDAVKSKEKCLEPLVDSLDNSLNIVMKSITTYTQSKKVDSNNAKHVDRTISGSK